MIDEASVGWLVLVALGVIASLGFMIGKPIMSLVTTLTLLKRSIDDLLADHKELRCENKEDHKAINENLKNHEGRIVNVEKKLDIV